MNTEDSPADAKSAEAQVCVNTEDGAPYAKSVEARENCPVAGVNTKDSAADAKSVAQILRKGQTSDPMKHTFGMDVKKVPVQS